MTKQQPIFGVDVSGWQPVFDMKQAKLEGMEFAIVKATEGPYRDGSTFTNPHYKTQIRTARDAGLFVGVYHFLVQTPAKAQVDHFLEVVGDVEGKILVVDYEAYPNFPILSPTMATLEDFVTELRRRVGNHPIVVYAGQGYWEEPPANGPITHLDVTTWDAFYPLGFEVGAPRVLYEGIKTRGWGERWGNQEPMLWQFSSTGRVAGLNVDVNALQGSLTDLARLTTGHAAQNPAPGQETTPKPDPRSSQGEGLILPRPSSLHDPGSGPYVRAHPTHYNWREDVEQLVIKYLNHPNLKGRIWINTYRDHPPGWGLDAVSFDVWDWKGRGHALTPELRKLAFDIIFGDPTPPKIRWCISGGGLWSSGGGWEPWNPPEDGSDAGHWRHGHYTYW